MLIKTVVGMAVLNSSTVDELREGAQKDGGAASTRAEHIG